MGTRPECSQIRYAAREPEIRGESDAGEPPSSLPGRPLWVVLKTEPSNLLVRDADLAGRPYHQSGQYLGNRIVI
jgi:hypothetical protein